MISILQGLSYFPVSLYIATFATKVASPLSATAVLSVFNSSGVVGQILIGHLTDRFPYAWVMFASALGSGAAAFLLWGFATTLPSVFAFAIIFGSLVRVFFPSQRAFIHCLRSHRSCQSGGFASSFPSAAADCAGDKPEQAGIILASAFLLKGVSAIIGPIVSGILYDAGRPSLSGAAGHYGSFGFESVELFVGTCAVATSIGSILVSAMRRRVHAS